MAAYDLRLTGYGLLLTAYGLLAAARWRGVDTLEHARHVARAAFEERHALLHPLGLWLTEQAVIEELILVHGPVLHVVAVAQTVEFAVVVEEVRFLAQP